MKRKPISKAQLCQLGREDQIIKASNKAHLLVTLAVLNDVFEFTPDDMNDFVDCYETLLQSYNAKKEDIKNLSDHIYAIAGIKIL